MTEIAPLVGHSFDALAFASQRFALISSSGGGKSYGCGRIVEDLHDAGIPVVVVDTVGIWPAVRLAADGKSPGLPFVIVGGEHADVPFVPARAGELARFLVRQNAHVVVDVSDLMPDERAAPLAEFFETALIEIKAIRRPRFFVLDEAQDLVPESAGKGEARLVRAVSAFVRKSRNHMCGTALLTQRPQDVAKSVLNQVGNLFVGMLFGEHERRAIARWVSSNANSADAHEQLKRLAELQPGEFFFWSPSWQKTFGQFRFAKKRTFDGSSGTLIDPAAVLGKVAPVDVAALRQLLAPPAPKGKAPKGLPEPDVEHLSNGTSAEHAALVEEIDQLHDGMSWLQERLTAAQRENAELRRELTHTLDELQTRCTAAAKQLRAEADELERAGGYAEAGRAVLGTDPEPDRPLTPPPPRLGYLERRERGLEPDRKLPEPPAKAKAPKLVRDRDDVGELDAYSETLVAAIKAYGPITRKQLALVTGVSLISSTFSTSLGKLHADGWIQTVDGKLVADGAVVGVGEPRLARGRAVREFWRTSRLDAYKCKLLDAVLAQRGGLTRAELAKAADVSKISSTFSTSLGQLKRAGLFVNAGGKVALSPEARWAMLG